MRADGEENPVRPAATSPAGPSRGGAEERREPDSGPGEVEFPEPEFPDPEEFPEPEDIGGWEEFRKPGELRREGAPVVPEPPPRTPLPGGPAEPRPGPEPESAPADDAVPGGPELTAAVAADGLSAQDTAVLALESRGGRVRGGAKERVIREQLEMSPTRYYQLLNALLDDPAALRHAPVTVNRLRRVRDERRAQR
ncbi:DUF3263 domain-containing protein [Streptomyces spiramenti]|uniref:DUF3263 domain-containing protein n=1 Tax=Streptomyces spiramenti TaxID=2720606 RepID=A0ABX1AQ25_9ACTN|nr:DUF3263 domain-containing protein [Streptomyces spiramenti]NJP69203.1 DUF3263 domain-containing protein [Streptomyces spiramenti]